VNDRCFVLATRSEGKLRELREILSDFALEVVDLSTLGIAESAREHDLERFETFEENALAKARYFFDLTGGMPTFCDDSGLCVDALGGGPGAHSKRWSGQDHLEPKDLDEANNAKLTTRMREARSGQGERFTDAAKYVCVAAFKDRAGELTRRGEIEGRVLSIPRGAGGFGYDPYFEAPDLGGTFAESSIKNTAVVSHRARAFRALLSALRAEGRI
jgi:XTP/dITP diphosphohydrolase